MPGAAISQVEVTNVSQHGFWLLLDGGELFLPFEEFPWFKQATVGAILRLERPAPGQSPLARSRRRPSRRLDRAPRALPAQVKALSHRSLAATASLPAGMRPRPLGLDHCSVWQARRGRSCNCPKTNRLSQRRTPAVSTTGPFAATMIVCSS
jgi:hypothetical protein